MIPPPFVDGFVFAIETDKNLEYVTPTVTEGTFAPAIAYYEMSNALTPYVSVDIQNTPIDIKISYSVSETAD